MRAYGYTCTYRDQWVFPDYLPLTDALYGWWQVRVGDGTHGNRVGPENSNSETHMTAICDFTGIYMLCNFKC